MADRIIMSYGPPGSGKTRALITLIKWLYLLTGKTARVYVGDGSYANYVDSGLIEAGIVEVFNYANTPWPMTVTNQMGEGYWPDPKTGKLAKPDAATLNRIGLWGFEALSTMMRDYMMGNIKGGLAEQSARGIKIGQDSPFQIADMEVTSLRTDIKGNVIGANYKDGTGTGEKFGGNPLSHFNVAQTHAIGVVRRSTALPGWVWWSSHEKLGEEKKKDGQGENARVTVTGDIGIGPEVAGSALSMTIARSFNDTLHFTRATKLNRQQDGTTSKAVNTVEDEYRLYTRDHYDPDGIVAVPYKAVVRCDNTPLPLYFTDKDGESSVVRLYKTLLEARKKARDEAEALKRMRAELEAKAGVA